jgi:hypothetical protein
VPRKLGQAQGGWPCIWGLKGGGPGEPATTAFRILYRSTGLNGQPIPVSGSLFIPPGPAAAEGRNFIAWAHPTSGVESPCAPSLTPDVSGMIGLGRTAEPRDIVVATDHPGLESEGRPVLDSVRESASNNWVTRLENVAVTTLVEPVAMPVFEKVAHDCIESVSATEGH